MLFERCLHSARTALQLVTELQQLIGHVERVTEMVELLDAVTDKKREQEWLHPLNTEKMAELDAIIDRYQFKITVTTPLPDRVAKRDFGKLHPTPHHFYAANEDPIFADVSG